jgi:uncharacterized protein YhbP (UPF0306 family)
MIAIKCTYTTTINHSANDINQSLNEILAANKLLSMATVTPQNNSWINTAYYAYDNFLNIYIVTYPSAQHSKNAEYNSTCAISIFDSHHESGPKGSATFWRDREATSETLRDGTKIYQDRYEWLKKRITKVDAWEKDTSITRLYHIQITRAKIFDEKIFGEET